MSTDVRHDRTTIQWTVSRIAYTPENYTVHFGTSSGSLTPFNQQQQSGNNFTATNLQFSVQLTGLSAGTTYYYLVVAMNSVGSTASDEHSFTTTELRKLAKVISYSSSEGLILRTQCGPAVAGDLLLSYASFRIERASMSEKTCFDTLGILWHPFSDILQQSETVAYSMQKKKGRGCGEGTGSDFRHSPDLTVRP